MVWGFARQIVALIQQLIKKFPTLQNREFIYENRDLNHAIRQCFGLDRQTVSLSLTGQYLKQQTQFSTEPHNLWMVSTLKYYILCLERI